MKIRFRFDRLRKIRPRTWLLMVVRTGGVVVLIIYLFLMWLPYFALMWLCKDDPAQWRPGAGQYLKLEWKHYDVPATVWAVTPYGAEIKARAAEFRKAWEAFENNTIVIEGKSRKVSECLGSRTKTDYDTVQRQSPSFDQAALAFEKLVSNKEYMINAISADIIYPTPAYDAKNQTKSFFPYPNYLIHTQMIKMLCARAESLATEGKTSEALQAVTLGIRGSRSEPYDMLISQLIGIADCRNALESWKKIIKQSNDPKLLREALRLENSLSKYPADYQAPPWGEVPLGLADMIGAAREAMRRGVKVDTRPASFWALYAIGFRAMGIYERDVAARALSQNPALASQAWQSGTSWIAASETMEGRITPVKPTLGWLNRAIKNKVEHAFAYMMSFPSYSESRGRIDYCMAKFDLLRMETARKLYEIEQGKPLARAADLAPDYLPSIPKDYATGRKEAYRRGADGFYSIGPDRKDQRGSLVYDPTNGTLSAGDVCVDVK